MTKKQSNVTMKDVAQEAGVALGTVSKVVNGVPVGEFYRTRVEKAIAKLNYRVNNYARGLRNKQTNIIEVMVPDLVNPFFCSLVSHVRKELSKRNVQMLLATSNYDPEQEQACMIMGEQHMVDGIICLSYNPSLRVSEKIPLISIDRSLGSNIPCVSSDNYGGGRLAAQKLVENGCKNLAFFKIGSKLPNEPSKRKDGFVSACEELGVPYTLKIVEDNVSYSVFREFLLENMHDGKLPFDGIFCVTDYLAYQVMQFLTEMNIRVPEDIQIIGFDGLRHFGNLELYCSTIVQPLDKIAEACVTMLLDKQLGAAPYLLCLPVSYACGGTTRT